jgi:hypothetical protein
MFEQQAAIGYFAVNPAGVKFALQVERLFIWQSLGAEPGRNEDQLAIHIAKRTPCCGFAWPGTQTRRSGAEPPPPRAAAAVADAAVAGALRPHGVGGC